jgi:hypothetical protein
MPRAARVGVDPQRGSSFLSHNKYGKLLLHREDVNNGKNGIPVIGRNESSRPCGSDLALPEFGAATFLNVSGAVRMELFAPQAPRRHT